MARQLDIVTLDQAAKDYASHFLLPNRFSKRNPKIAIGGREWVLQNFCRLGFKDEFEYMLPRFKEQLGPKPLTEFEEEAVKRFTPRSDEVLAKWLAEKLAITPEGDHIPGMVGTCIIGHRSVGRRVTRHGMADASWSIYAGEEEERALGNVRMLGKDGPGMDPLPPEDTFWANETDHMGQPSVLMALNTNVSIAFAQAGLDPALNLLDQGTADGVLRGVSGTQPVDPNAALTGSVLFEQALSAVAFPASADGAPGALATASAVDDDADAAATGTLSHVRVSSSNSFPTPLNDHIDGSAGLTSGTFDFEYNTVAIVINAIVSLTSWTVTQPQGPTAT